MAGGTALPGNYIVNQPLVQQGEIIPAVFTAAHSVSRNVKNGAQRNITIPIGELTPEPGNGLSLGAVSYELDAYAPGIISAAAGLNLPDYESGELRITTVRNEVGFIGSEEITVRLITQNYGIINVPVTLTAVEKDILTFTGLSGQDINYTGLPYTGYTGTWTFTDEGGSQVIPDNPEVTVLYTGSGETVYHSENPPVNVGSYQIRLSLDADTEYRVLTKGGEALSAAGIDFIAGENQVLFAVKDNAVLEEIKSAIKLEINSAGTPFRAPIKISFRITGRKPSFSISQKNRIDLANPLSEITATVKLKNTFSEIEEVRLYGQKMLNNVFSVPDVSNFDLLSDDFEVVPDSYNGNTFKIKAKHDIPTAKLKQKISVWIKLKNGEELTSWYPVISGGNTEWKDKPLLITPIQTVGKAYQSKKEVTLYKNMVRCEDGFALDLTTPVNTSLGEVKIADSTANSKLKFANDSGFELVRNGLNNWSIRFKDGIYPTALNGRA